MLAVDVDGACLLSVELGRIIKQRLMFSHRNIKLIINRQNIILSRISNRRHQWLNSAVCLLRLYFQHFLPSEF